MMGDGEVGVKNLSLTVKVLAIFMGIMGVVGTVWGATNFLIDMKQTSYTNARSIEIVLDRANENADDIDVMRADARTFEKEVSSEMKELRAMISALALGQKENATHYVSILREVERLSIKFDNFEVND